MAQTAEKLEQRTVMMVARDCLRKAKGDWKKADALFKRELARDQGLYDELVGPLVDAAVWTAISKAGRDERQKFKVSGLTVGPDNTNGLNEIAQKYADDWLSYPMRGGKRLGDASKDDLLQEIEMHELFASENKTMAVFYGRILKRMGRAKQVKDKLTNDVIASINEEVRHA